jgi:hypothetical protein
MYVSIYVYLPRKSVKGGHVKRMEGGRLTNEIYEAFSCGVARQNKRITPLSFLDGCRKRRLKG